jgi:hypothetical protein
MLKEQITMMKGQMKIYLKGQIKSFALFIIIRNKNNKKVQTKSRDSDLL